MSDTYSPDHPHGPAIEEALDSEGRCLWCRDHVRADAAEAQRDRLAKEDA